MVRDSGTRIFIMRILVVEDENKVGSFIKRGLEAANYSVDVERDGEAGLRRLVEGGYDLVILDVMLPRLDGFNVMKEIRQRGIQIPILLLTARIALADKVTGLDLGADDYLTKPFAFEELLARVRALLRRGSAAAPTVLTAADLTLDPATRQVTRAGKRIDLTSKEYALLEFLLRRRDQVLSRAVIAQHVWGVDYDTFTNVIDVYVNYLRKKIDSGFEPKLIHTVRGFGYVLKEEPPAP
jgi:heavy metal response regulator